MNINKISSQSEDFGDKYRKSLINNYFVNKYFSSVEKLIEKVNFSKSFNVLEVGCGEGHSTNRLKKMFKHEIIFESSEYLNRQVIIAKKINPDVKIIQENVYCLKRKNNFFNLIILLEVLEHLEEPNLAIEELHRVTNDYILVGVPNEPLWRIMNFLRGKYFFSLGNTPGHLNHWPSKKIVSFIESKGFELIEIEKPIPWTIGLFKKVKND